MNTATKSYLRELRRPWKLFTLYIGIGVLVAGAKFPETAAPDWDVGVSFLMAGFSYLTAPQAVRAMETFFKGLFKRRLEWEQLLLGVLLTIVGADSLYAIYWSYYDPKALELMREANFLASVCLYLLMGMLWKPRCSLADMLRELSTTLHLRPRVER